MGRGAVWSPAQGRGTPGKGEAQSGVMHLPHTAGEAEGLELAVDRPESQSTPPLPRDDLRQGTISTWPWLTLPSEGVAHFASTVTES